MLSPHLFGYFLALMAAVSWAVAPVLYRRGVDRISYSGLGALRCNGYLVSAALFLFLTMGPSAFAEGLKMNGPLPRHNMIHQGHQDACFHCVPRQIFILGHGNKIWGDHDSRDAVHVE